MLLLLGDRRQEDDRDCLRALALLDQRRCLEAVEPGHLDVEQDHGDVVLQELPQSLLAGVGEDQILLQRLEDGLEGEEILLPVVDQEDVGFHAFDSAGTAAGSTHRP